MPSGKNKCLLTTGGGARPEDRFDRGIHEDGNLSLVLHLLVSGVDSGLDPLFKLHADDGPQYVGDVAAGQLEDLGSYGRQCPHGFLILVGLGERDELLDRQVLEVRHLDHLEVSAVYSAAVVATEVPKMPGRHAMGGW